MTDNDRTTTAPRAQRIDAGVPRGPARRKHCGICGAEGVDRRTCTGDAGSHAALDQGYKPTPLPRVQGPTTADGPGRTGIPVPATTQADMGSLRPDIQAEMLADAGAISPDLAEPEIAWKVRDQDALTAQEHIAHEVVVAVVTRYPALVMGRLEHLIEENLEEALWVSTRAYGLTRDES
jgi:hypothetical protein